MFNKRNLFVYLPLVVSLAGCSSSDNAVQGECEAGQVVTGFKDGKPVCFTMPTCPSGQIMTGTNTDGTPICATQTLVCPTDFTLALKDGTPVVCFKATEGAVETPRPAPAQASLAAITEDVTWIAANDECLSHGAHLCYASEFQAVCETLGPGDAGQNNANIILGMWLGDAFDDNIYSFTNVKTCYDFEGPACKLGYNTTPNTACPTILQNPPDCWVGDIDKCFFVGGYCCIEPQPKIQ
jgi:hypothetical protein